MTFEDAIDYYNEVRRLGGWDQNFHAVLQKVCDLDAKLDRLISRFESMLEANEMWDGS